MYAHMQVIIPGLQNIILQSAKTTQKVMAV